MRVTGTVAGRAPEAPAPPGPLDGVTVVDLTSVIMGPFATQVLGDLGADVITIEPAGGDPVRTMGPGSHPELSGIALNLLRNKRNAALDLRDPRGRAVLLRLAATADVFVSNLRPGSLRRLRLTDDDLRVARPDIVYCRVCGFGSDTERADDPAYDDVVQAAAGVADLAARIHGTPRVLPTVLADKVCGLLAAQVIVAALFHRERTGEGQAVEVSMVDAMRAFTLVEHGAGAIDVDLGEPAGYQRLLVPSRTPQRTRDGWVMVLPYTGAQYAAFFAAAGLDDVDPALYGTSAARLHHAATLYELIAGAVASRTTAEWVATCRAIDVPVAAVESLDDIVTGLPLARHPAAGVYRSIPPMARLDRTPARVRRPAPLTGEHTAEVLEAAGLDRAEIDRLVADGVARTGARDTGRGGDP